MHAWRRSFSKKPSSDAALLAVRLVGKREALFLGAWRRSFSKKPSSEAASLAVLPASLDPLGFKYFEHEILRARFDAYDVNKSGSIEVSEARQLLLDAKFCGEGEEDEAKLQQEAQHVVAAMDCSSSKDGTSTEPHVSWSDFKSAVDRSAEIVDKRVIPISAALLLNYSGQGATAPILPLLGRSLGLFLPQPCICFRPMQYT